MGNLKLPGIVYSLLLAVAAWAVEYFTEGAGKGVPWAPILVAAVPILLKSFTVQNTGPQEPVSTSRGLATYEEHVSQPSKMDQWLWG